MCPAFARVSFCLYLMRFVGTDKKKKSFLWATIATQLLVNTAVVLQAVTQCQEFHHLWDPSAGGKCISPRAQEYTGFFQGAWNASTDLLLTLLPFVMLRKLKIKLSTKMALLAVMSLSVFALAACVVKTVEIRAIGSRMDYTYDTSMFAVWFTTESYVVVVAASIPTLRPLGLWFMKRWSPSKRGKDSRESGTSSSQRPIRLHRLISGDYLELERPYIHQPSSAPPSPGVIRKTISLDIRTEERTGNAEPMLMNRHFPGHESRNSSQNGASFV